MFCRTNACQLAYGKGQRWWDKFVMPTLTHINVMHSRMNESESVLQYIWNHIFQRCIWQSYNTNICFLSTKSRCKVRGNLHSGKQSSNLKVLRDLIASGQALKTGKGTLLNPITRKISVTRQTINAHDYSSSSGKTQIGKTDFWMSMITLVVVKVSCKQK